MQNTDHSGTTASPAAQELQPLETFLSSLKRTRSKKTLELHQKRLQFLAQNFDPFAGDVSSECAQIMQQYQISLTALDPFRFTNLVLQMLDALEEKIKSH
jgi:hypothetical protein